MTTAELYREAFEEGGRRVTLERLIPNQPTITAANVRARILGLDAEDVAGGIKSTDRRILILAEDVPLALRPLKQGDRVLLDGLRLIFKSRPDDQSRRDGEILLAYEGIAAGA